MFPVSLFPLSSLFIVLLRMPNVEVLSLSVNSISSLSCFRKCSRLRELYLRKNDVRNLADIQYLASIRCLKILWLSDNPCAETDEYRATVIQYLPNLEKLDNVDVTDSERLSANAGALLLPRLEDSLERNLVVPAGPPPDFCVERDSDSRDVAEEERAGDVSAKEGPGRVNGGLAQAGVGKGDGTSPHILYAVIALLEELDEDSLRIVKAEVESRL